MESQQTSGTGSVLLDDKSKTTLSDWLGDIVALESHIEEALDRQLKQVSDDAVASKAVKEFHALTKRQRDALKSLQESYGGTAGSPIKQAGSALLGKAAGVINMLRAEGDSKALRDDYTAFNLAAISYTMLHTTAVALGDQKVAGMAEEHLRGYAKAIQQINHLISDVVVAELAKDDHKVQTSAADQTRTVVDKVWSETAKAGQDTSKFNG